MNTIPSTLPAMPPCPRLKRPAKLPDYPVLMDNSNVLPSPITGECAVQSLNQKSNSSNDLRSISQEDNNSTNVCHEPPPSPSNSSSTISQLSATTLPTDSDLVKSGKPADAYTWKCYGTKGLIRNRRRSFYWCAHPGCRVKKSVEWSLDGQITEVINRALHNHSVSQPTRTSSISAFSHVIRASNHLTIKIPDKSFVTYEGGQMDADGLDFFMRSVEDENRLQNLMDKNFDQPSDRCKAAIGVDVRKAKKWKPAKATVFKLTTGSNFREIVQRFTGMQTNEVQEERRMRGIPRKEVWEANRKEISGSDIQCVWHNADRLY